MIVSSFSILCFFLVLIPLVTICFAGFKIKAKTGNTFLDFICNSLIYTTCAFYCFTPEFNLLIHVPFVMFAAVLCVFLLALGVCLVVSPIIIGLNILLEIVTDEPKIIFDTVSLLNGILRRGNSNQDKSSSMLIQLLFRTLDEEGISYFTNSKAEWSRLKIAQNQVKQKELMFILDHLRGKFITWMELPRFLSSKRTR